MLRVGDAAIRAVATLWHGQADELGHACTHRERFQTGARELDSRRVTGTAHVSVLLIDVAKLEPNIPRGQWPRWIIENVLEALRNISSITCIAISEKLTTDVKTRLILPLMLVDDSETEVDFIGLLKVCRRPVSAWKHCAAHGPPLTRIHLENARKGLFGVVKGSVSIVEYANSIPQFRLLYHNELLTECCAQHSSPLDFGDDKEPVDTLYKPWVDRPSSTDNVLFPHVSLPRWKMSPYDPPIDPHTSPLSCLIFNILWKYSMALSKLSLLLAIEATALRPSIEVGLWRRAFSNAARARS